MKKTALLLVFLGMVLCCHAQKSSKNEFSLGYFSAGEFFDNTKFDFSRFVRGRAISLAYTREIGKKRSIGISYGSCTFNYFPDTPQPFEDNTVLGREQNTLSVNFGYGIPIGPILARAKAGLRYNMVGGKMVHYRYINGGASWHTIVWGHEAYSKLGAKIGASMRHPIVWRFFGELDCEYARMFSGADRNQLILSYRLGFRF